MSDSYRVLLVDDSAELLAATRELLAELGHTVATARRGEEALERFETAPPAGGFDLLVSDVYMPGTGGLELADALVSRSPDLAVLLISSRGGEPALRRRLARGDVAFVAKPFSPRELAAGLAAARAAAGKRRAEPPGAGAGASRWRPRPAWGLAAAAVLVIGLGAALRDFRRGAPPLPARGPEAYQRSATVRAISPSGRVAEMPAELAWQPVAGAGAYAVRLVGVDGTALWQTETDVPRAPLPAGVTDRLHRAVTYDWSVEALDPRGGLLARSGPVWFEVELEP